MTASATRAVDYLGWGLVIRSELKVAGGWPLDPSDARRPDVVIGFGTAALTGPCALKPPYAFGEGRILFDAPRVARYLIEPDRILVEPVVAADGDHVRDLLIATALPALLWLRGGFVLHAGCVTDTHGGGVAFAGPSGSGKSRLCALLVGEGWGAVGDDSIAPETGDEGVRAAGLPACLTLSLPPPATRAVRSELTIPDDQRRRSARLETICLLRPAAGASPWWTRLDPVEAVGEILANRHRPAVPRGLKMEPFCLDHAAEIARSVAVMALEFDPATITSAALIECLATP